LESLLAIGLKGALGIGTALASDPRTECVSIDFVGPRNACVTVKFDVVPETFEAFLPLVG
jgi:hypothetical protein